MKMHQPDYNREFEEKSGVRHVSTIVKKKKNDFEHALIDMANDKTLGYLVAFGYKPQGRSDFGLLQGLVLDLRDFQEKYLDHLELVFDGEAQEKALEEIFAKTMQLVIKKWPLLEKQGYNWEQLCKALRDRMAGVAKVFGLDEMMENNISKWFVDYQKGAVTKQKFTERNEQNKRALEAYGQLAYLSTVGADKKVIDQVRHRIAGIDKKLTALPVDLSAEAIPAFSKVSHHPVKKVIIDEPTLITRKPKLMEKKDVVAPKKSFWQRLKFWE